MTGDHGFSKACPSGNKMTEWDDDYEAYTPYYDAVGKELIIGDQVVILNDTDCFVAGTIVEVTRFDNKTYEVEVMGLDAEGFMMEEKVKEHLLSKE